jgi:hypothetical protein
VEVTDRKVLSAIPAPDYSGSTKARLRSDQFNAIVCVKWELGFDDDDDTDDDVEIEPRRRFRRNNIRFNNIARILRANDDDEHDEDDGENNDEMDFNDDDENDHVGRNDENN